MQRSTFTFTNAREHRLHCVEYKPAVGTRPKAALFLHHGIAEHIGRYDAVFSRWARDHALCVYGYDCHGHGLSDPPDPDDRVYVHSFGDLVDDLTGFLAHVRRERGLPQGLPAVVGGHSLGGLVAAHAVLRLAAAAQEGPGDGTSSSSPVASLPPAAGGGGQRGEESHVLATTASTGMAGLLLHSAALDVVWSPVLRALAAVGAALALAVPRARVVPAVKPADMHPDPAVVQDYLDDPLVIVGNTRARTANEVLRGFRGLAGKERLFALPVLAVHGSDDRTTSLAAVRSFVGGAAAAGAAATAARAAGGEAAGGGSTGAGGVEPGAGARLRVVEGGYHELMAAPGEREREADEVAAWVEGLPAVRAWVAAGPGGAGAAGARGGAGGAGTGAAAAAAASRL